MWCKYNWMNIKYNKLLIKVIISIIISCSDYPSFEFSKRLVYDSIFLPLRGLLAVVFPSVLESPRYCVFREFVMTRICDNVMANLLKLSDWNLDPKQNQLKATSSLRRSQVAVPGSQINVTGWAPRWQISRSTSMTDDPYWKAPSSCRPRPRRPFRRARVHVTAPVPTSLIRRSRCN